MLTALTNEQMAIRETVRRFAQEELAPRAYEVDRDEQFPARAWQRAAELGLLGITAPEQYGGSGLGLVDMCVIGEELAGGCLSTSVGIMHQADMVVDSIVRNGTDDQKERFLPSLCDGTKIAALSITEPEAGSDALAMRTAATRVDGGWMLSGTKTFITNGPVADLALVYAKTGPVASREMGLFIVDMQQAGSRHGPKLEKMGWRGSPTGELVFDGAYVPDGDVLGGAGNGLRVLMSGLNSERVVMAAQAVGLARAAFEASVRYAQERHQFGRPIGEFQLVRAKLADMYSRIQAVRALTYEAAAAGDVGDVGDLRRVASAAKILAADMVMDVTTDAVQILGGYGYTKEYPVERYMRDAKLFQIGGGTVEILRDLLGRDLVRAEGGARG